MQDKTHKQSEGTDRPLPMSNQKTSQFKQYRSRITLALVIFLIITVTLINRHRILSPEEKLAAMDAARAIPDSENAALVYAKLLSNFVTITSLSDLAIIPASPSILENILIDFETDIVSKDYPAFELSLTHNQPWSRKQNPLVAEWINDQAWRINILMEASRLPNCRFLLCCPVNEYSWQDMLINICLWRSLILLEQAAYFDLGEGQAEDAMHKAKAMIRISRHLRQHPTEFELRLSLRIETDGLNILNQWLMTCEPVQQDVNTLRDFCGQFYDQWESIRHLIELPMKHIHTMLRMEDRWNRLRNGNWAAVLDIHQNEYDLSSDTIELYHDVLRQRRIHRILLELRTFKNHTGQWPTHIRQIVSALPDEVIQEIYRLNPYTHFLADDSFILFNLHPDDPNSDEMEIMVQDDDIFTPKENKLLEKQVQFYIDTFLPQTWSKNEMLIRIAPYSLPVLLANLKRSNIEVKLAIIHTLAYLYNVPPEQHELIIQTLKGIANQPTEKKYLRIEAIRALVFIFNLFDMDFSEFSERELWMLQQELYVGMRTNTQLETNPELKVKLDEWIEQMDFDPNALELIDEARTEGKLWLSRQIYRR